jgi:alkaline phosphatase
VTEARLLPNAAAAIFVTLALAAGAHPAGAATAAEPKPAGNVIFFHPDGLGLNSWSAGRILLAGPDGRLAWDGLPAMAVYTGHMKDNVTATSNGGATTHAYGVKVSEFAFGDAHRADLTAASGRNRSLAEEAYAAGKAVGFVQSGHLSEPGTAAFLASWHDREARSEIAAQLILGPDYVAPATAPWIKIEARPAVLLGGGERYLLPEGVSGRHGPGVRRDGLNLIEAARARGYTIVYTRAELAALDPARVERVLGVFAADHTFSDQSFKDNERDGKPNYAPDAPSIKAMMEFALALLTRDPDGFLLVAEEEGTDNFGNANNVSGWLEALRRSDEAIAFARAFVAERQDTLLLVASDSDAAGLQLRGLNPDLYREGGSERVGMNEANGAPVHGTEGRGSLPFFAAPDRAGKRWPVQAMYASPFDVSGGGLVRADGFNRALVSGTLDNTDIYKIMYRTLFAAAPWEADAASENRAGGRLAK